MKSFDIKCLLPHRRCLLEISGDCSAEIIDKSVRLGCYLRIIESGEVTVVEVTSDAEKDLRRLLSNMGYSCIRKRNRLFEYRKRYGLIVGLVVFLIIISFFSNLLWSIDVSGNKRLSDAEVKKILEICGVTEGIPIRKIDNDKIRIEAMNISKDIGWLSVNVKGMRADVVIAEAVRTPAREENNGYSHIIAACDGIISEIVVESGVAMVRPGDTVRKGEMLVSGIIEERDGDVALTKAKARIYAKTEHVIEVYQEYKAENKHVIGEKLRNLTINFLGKSINFHGIYGLDASECDIIHKRGSVYLFEGFRLPVSYVAEYCLLSEESSVSLSNDAARDAAERTAYDRLFSSADVELLSKRLVADYGEDGVKITLYAVCEENISIELPFAAEP